MRAVSEERFSISGKNAIPRRGFSLVEALLACALLAIVLVPALAAMRLNLQSVARLREKRQVEDALDNHLATAAARLRRGEHDAAISGLQRNGLMVLQMAPEATPCGNFTLWHFSVKVSDPISRYTAEAGRWLLLPNDTEAKP